MDITLSQIKAIMPNFEANIRKNPHFAGYTPTKVVGLLNQYAKEFHINTRKRWCHYLAQIAHESGEFRYTEEIASGKAYDTGTLAVRLGNTPQADGDGQRYKGRGLIQLTGLTNYKLYRAYCGYDVVKNPELLAKPVGATRSSMWYFDKNGINALADRDDIKAVTKRINGGYNGLEERTRYYTRAMRAIPV